MILRQELVIYLSDYLSVDTYQDYAPNGLQIEGKEKIQLICSAVTASQEVIKQAIKLQADALLVHHGYFWSGESAAITGIKKQRISALLKHDVNLLAYHLPLDCHKEIGNNACIATKLAIVPDSIKTYKVGKIDNLLWVGDLQLAYKPQDFHAHLHDRFQHAPVWVNPNEKQLVRVAWCSGAAQDYLEIAHSLGADAYISGEISERTYYQALELNIHYFACGHHATERDGIQALGEHLANKFGLQHRFIDSENFV